MSFGQPKLCIDQVENWIKLMGVDSLERKGNRELKITFKTPIGPQYCVFVYFYDGLISLESPLFLNVSGRLERVNLFNSAILELNAALGRIFIAIVPFEGEKAGYILKSTQNASLLTPRDFKNILDHFHQAHCSIIPRLIDTATELELKFDGKKPSLLKDLIKDILGNG